MSKKIIFPIVAIVLAIATIIVGVLIIVKNTGDCTIIIEQKTVLAGDVVSVPIVIDKNFGIWGGQVIIDYDPNVLTFHSGTKGEVFDECEVNDAGNCIALLLTQTELKDTKKDGTVAILNFQVKSSAKDGSYALKFNEETNFCNSKEEMVEPILNDGAIKVK